MWSSGSDYTKLHNGMYTWPGTYGTGWYLHPRNTPVTGDGKVWSTMSLVNPAYLTT